MSKINDILKPAFIKNNIPVIFSADDNYAPYLGVTVHSLVSNASNRNNYDIIILEKDMSEINKNLILTNKQKNISIRFMNISHLLEGHKFHINTYFSEETYYRLFIPTVFQNYTKVIYLDCDIIILSDIANLYKINLDEKLLAATYNISTYVQQKYNKPVKGIFWFTYLKEILNLKNPENYFQAGVLVFNVSEMRRQNIQEKALKLVESFEPVLVDQDILNSICQERVKYFSQQWNLHNHFSIQYKNTDSLLELPNTLQEDYLVAKRNANIIHYAGKEKPWSHPYLEYSYLWWKYARQTPFYEEIIYRNVLLNQPTIQTKQNTPLLPIMKDVFNYKKNYINYVKYKLLTKLTWGKKHNKYKQKKKMY